MAEAAADPFKGQPPFGAEYAKTARASCKGCKKKIEKDELRMSVRTRSPFFDGLQDTWYHFDCFWKKANSDLLKEGNIRGIESLKWDDQELIRKRMAEVLAQPKVVPKNEIPKFDIAANRAGKCFKCKDKIEKGTLRVFYKSKYHHPRCIEAGIITDAPSVDGYNYLEKEKQEEAVTIFGKKEEEKKPTRKRKSASEKAEEAKAKKEEAELIKKLENQSKVLWEAKEQMKEFLTPAEVTSTMWKYNLNDQIKNGPNECRDIVADFFVFGLPAPCPECKGQLVYSPALHTYRCTGHISGYTPCEYTHRNPERTKFELPSEVLAYTKKADKINIPTLDERTYSKDSDKIDDALTLISSGPKSKRKRKESENEEKSEIVKNGCVIDSRCEYAQYAHVYVDANKVAYQAFLHNTVVSTNTNSYYKLQMLEDDASKRYYVFKAWGRIGTNQGGTKTEVMGSDFTRAINTFKSIFREKTNNHWEHRANFKKEPGKFDYLEVEHDGKDAAGPKKLDPATSKSKLPLPVQELISTILDIHVMNTALQEMKIDTKKMPLGKLSNRQILNAYSRLKEIEEVLESAKVERSKIIDLSNQFYTLVPHNTGHVAPPILDNLELVKEKSRLLDELMELEIAYSIIKEAEKDSQTLDEKDPIDLHYEKIGCDMEVLDPESETYKMIVKYAETTHAPTHTGFKLEIDKIFAISRKKEDEVFMKDVGNINLLWHGSRLSNFAGILSKGLRIAPPEAPPNGYLFGKGIYFADMVSKSAQYCMGWSFRPEESIGLLLLSEVALGKLQELKDTLVRLKLWKIHRNSRKRMFCCQRKRRHRSKSQDLYYAAGRCRSSNRKTDKTKTKRTNFAALQRVHCLQRGSSSTTVPPQDSTYQQSLELCLFSLV